MSDREQISQWTKGPSGFLPRANDMVRAINTLQPTAKGPVNVNVDPRTASPAPTLAQITDANSLGGNQWAYSWSRVQGDGSAWPTAYTDAEHGKARNGAEFSNTSNFAGGVDFTALDDGVTAEALPISGQTPILPLTLYPNGDGTSTPIVVLQNPIIYTCDGDV